MATLYILYSPTLDRYYVGSTERFEERLQEHQRGQTTSTKNGCPWTVELRQNFETTEMAHAWEMKLKRWKSRSLIQRIISDGGVHV